MHKEYDITPDIQDFFTKTNLTNEPMNNAYKSKVFDIFEETGFFSITHNKGKNSARMKDASYELSKTIATTRNLPISKPPAGTEKSEKQSANSEGVGMKIIIPSNVIDN